MSNFLIGIQKFCSLGPKLGRLNGVRNMCTRLNHTSVYNNNLMSLMMMNLHELAVRGNYVPQMPSKLSQLVSNRGNIVNHTFSKNIACRDIIQNHICDPSIQNDETLQLDSVLRKRRKKMKKHKLRKRRKREKALKRKISQGQKK